MTYLDENVRPSVPRFDHSFVAVDWSSKRRNWTWHWFGGDEFLNVRLTRDYLQRTCHMGHMTRSSVLWGGDELDSHLDCSERNFQVKGLPSGNFIKGLIRLKIRISINEKSNRLIFSLFGFEKKVEESKKKKVIVSSFSVKVNDFHFLIFQRHFW